jgi:hypothetical protein
VGTPAGSKTRPVQATTIQERKIVFTLFSSLHSPFPSAWDHQQARGTALSALAHPGSVGAARVTGSPRVGGSIHSLQGRTVYT